VRGFSVKLIHPERNDMATNSKKILILAGDGIGPEVMGEVKRVLGWFDKRRHAGFETEDDLIGGCSYDAHGTPLTDKAMEKALKADAVLLGAVGGPKWEKLPFKDQPERGLLRIRKDMQLFANLRPAIVFDALAEASSLKTELVKGLDIMIVRELTGGVYFGQPRGIETLPNGERKGVNTQVYTTSEIQRVARVAFELAQKRGKKLCSVEKANVMESGVLWREEVTKLAGDYPDVQLSHMYADNCAMQLVRQPKQFDVIVTDNLFGDLLSDCAAMLTGSLGMLPSASLGAADAGGKRKALYEPVHGSAPDIAGTGKANPLACLLSASMMLRYSFDMSAEADLLDKAASNVVARGIRTADIMSPGSTLVSTEQMGSEILKELDRLGA
jgi:3-isopropylmalate dehydrogenase